MRIINSFWVAVATVFVAVFLAASALAAYAPQRTTYKWPSTAKAVTFNSVIGNPSVGDERQFLTARDFSNNNYADQLSVVNNEDVVLKVYYHNNAKPGQIAKGTKVRFALPSGTSKQMLISAYISADNAKPSTVSDTTTVLSDQSFSLNYEPGSAQIWNNAVRGVSLNDSVVTSGALIGYKTLDGQVNGGASFSGYVTIKAKVKFNTPAPAAGGSVPNTGPGQVVALFIGVSVLATLVHMLAYQPKRYQLVDKELPFQQQYANV